MPEAGPPDPGGQAAGCARIAAAVRALLARGVAVTPAVERFIEATFLDPSPEGVQAMLAAESAEAGGPLLELLFSPDESQQIAIEPLLPDRALSPAEEALLVQALCRPPLAVEFRLPRAAGRLAVETTPALARRFVSGLGAARPVPGEIAQAIRTAVGRAPGLRLRVAVRNSRVRWSPGAEAALGAYIRRAGRLEDDGLGCITVALEVLAGPEAGADVFAAFAGRKRRLGRALEHSHRQAGMLARANIETLASGGVRLIAVDEADTRRRSACIDRFTLAVFDRVAPLGPSAGEARAAGENGPG